MKKITEEAFNTALRNIKATFESCEIGNSLFFDYTTMVKSNGVYFIRDIREYYTSYDTSEVYYQCDNEDEALAYFNEALEEKNLI